MRLLRRVVLLLAWCLTFVVSASDAMAATTLNVPADYGTIQAAINSSAPGDTVLVSPGTYHERIDFGGKAITVVSSGGAAVTVIDGDGLGTVVTMIASSGESPTLRGFTITDGSAPFPGGGILTRGGPAIIEDNRVVANLACLHGGGIAAEFSAAIIRRNLVVSNVQRSGCIGGSGGGGVFIGGIGSVVLVDNTIEGNSWGSSGGGISLNAAGAPTIARNVVRSNFAGSQGGAISIVNDSRARIENNLFVDNAAQEGGGIYSSVPSGSMGSDVANNTFVANSSTIGRAGSAFFSIGFHAGSRFANNVVVGSGSQALLLCDATYTSSPPVVLNNDVFNETGGATYGGTCAGKLGVDGNISTDPLFVDAVSGNYRPSAPSPLVDAGTNTGAPTTDLDGNPRPRDGDGDGVAVTDIGAYEPFGTFVPPDLLPPVITVADVVANATGPTGAVVTYGVSVSDDRDPSPILTCSPSSGSLFPIGTTTVTCTATDNAGNTSTATFTVTVLGALDQIAALRAAVATLPDVKLRKALDTKLRDASAGYQAGNLSKACNNMAEFQSQVAAQSGKGIPAATASQWLADAARIKNVMGCD